MHTILAAAAEAEARVLVLNEKCAFHSIYHSASTLIRTVIRIVELSQDLSYRLTQLDAARSQQREYVPSCRWTCTVNLKLTFVERNESLFRQYVISILLLYCESDLVGIAMKP